MPPLAGDAPPVVEGAAGLLVPVAHGAMMIDPIRQLALPVVLVARGTLGTVNHTLLSLEAPRARAIAIAGVVLNGETTDGNREAIARHGRVRITTVLPHLAQPDAASVATLARLIPPLDALLRDEAQ